MTEEPFEGFACIDQLVDIDVLAEQLSFLQVVNLQA
jgi:hypothetical protein